MKKVEAIVRHHKLEEIKEALVKAGHHGLTVTEVRGFGRQKGQKETYRGSEYVVEFVPKVKLEVACEDTAAAQVVEIIVKAARSGKIGDGKVFVGPLENVVRIRTGEQGSSAL